MTDILEKLKQRRCQLITAHNRAELVIDKAKLDAQIELLDTLISDEEKANDPHTELKSQYLKDVETCKGIDGLEAWQLWQFRHSTNSTWVTHEYLNVTNDDCEYRRHPHADSIIQYHQCSERDKQRWQYRNNGGTWILLSAIGEEPLWKELTEYRLKPDTIIIKDKEYTAPLREPPTMMAEYRVIDIKTNSVSQKYWDNEDCEKQWLKNNSCFATEEDAHAVLNAIQEILRGDYA